MESRQQAIIEHLRIVKDEKHLTFREIHEMTVANGEAVSESNIKKVFSPTEFHVHDYNKTIKPIARVIIGNIEDGHYPIAGSYAAINEYKDMVIDQLKEQCETLAQQKESASRKHREREIMLLEQIDFYKQQIRFKDEQIKRYEENIDRKDKYIKENILGKEE